MNRKNGLRAGGIFTFRIRWIAQSTFATSYKRRILRDEKAIIKNIKRIVNAEEPL